MSSPLEPHRGQRIGRYEVLSQLSVGGMAELFIGFTSGPGGFRKYAALKRILPDARSDEQFERMFLDEARITAAFNHPNIGQVFELGQDGDGLFLAMEFIAGQNLEDVIAAGQRAGGRLPLGFALSVVRDVCLALHYAHTFTSPGGRPHAVIHRDVAHKNVMVTYDGVVKLLDFGIAKTRGARAQTQVGMVKGTTGYMSPEQVRGEPLDGRSDLFSVGVMLHELLTGERLFSAGTEIQEMQMILGGSIPEPQPKGGPAVPREVCAVALKALARERTQRYATGREMARALEAAAGSLLDDAEQRAVFMAEHFQKQREQTRRLLQTVDDAEPSLPDALGADVSAEPTRLKLGADVSEVKTEVKPPLAPRRRAPEKRPVARSPAPAPKRKAEPEEATAPLEKEAAAARGAARAPVETFTAPPPPAPRRFTPSSVGLVAAVLVAGMLLGLAGLEVRGRLLARDTTAPARPVESYPTAPVPLDIPTPEPVQPPPPVVAASPDSSAPPEEAKEPSAAADASGHKEKEVREKEAPPARPGKQGWLTLITLPEAEVFLNGRSLGKTPLFKRAVPVGQHRLRIQGRDGKRRELAVPIQQGKTTQFKLSLADIPER